MTTQQSSNNQALVRIGHIGDGYDYLDKPTFFSIIAVRNISISDYSQMVFFITSLCEAEKVEFKNYDNGVVSICSKNKKSVNTLLEKLQLYCKEKNFDCIRHTDD